MLFPSPLQQRAVDNEKGLSANPLTLSWVSDNPIAETISQPSGVQDPMPSSPHPTMDHNPAHSFNSEVQHTTMPSSSERDYESITLMRMRQAEERRRLCEQLAQEEDELT